MSQEILKKLASVFTKQQLILQKLAQKASFEDYSPEEIEAAKQRTISMPPQASRPSIDSGKIIADVMKQLVNTPGWQQASQEQRQDLASDLAEAIRALSDEAEMGS